MFCLQTEQVDDKNFAFFEVVLSAPHLILIPQGPTLQILYRNLQIESNKLLRLFNTSEMKNLVIDLKKIDYLDSVIINSITRLLQQTRQTGGQSAMPVIISTPPHCTKTQAFGFSIRHDNNRDTLNFLEYTHSRS